MDSWSDKQIQSMRLGGNAKMIDWFKKNGVDPRASIDEKYHTDAAELYRLRLAAMRDGKPVPDELPPKAQQPPPQPAPVSDRPLTGFGSQPMPTGTSSNDPLDEISKTANELGKTASQTFSMLAGTFTSFGKEAAEKLKEVKISEKLSQTGDSLAKTSEKLTETLKDPELAQKAQLAAAQSWQKVSSSALNFWKTVVEPGVGGSTKESNAGSGAGYASMNQDDDEDQRLVSDPNDDDEDFHSAPSVKAPAPIRSAPVVESKPPQVSEDDEEWIQKQLEQMGTQPAAGQEKPASSQGGKKNEDFFSQFGV
jgi:hypothetical protein